MQEQKLITSKEAAAKLGYHYKSFLRMLKNKQAEQGLYKVTRRKYLICLPELLEGLSISYTKEKQRIVNKITLAKALQSYDSSYVNRLSDARKSSYKRAIELAHEFFRGGKELSKPNLALYIKFLRDEKELKDPSIKKYLDCLNVIFKQALKEESISKNPLEGFERNLIKGQDIVRFLSKEQYQLLQKNADKISPDLSHYIILAHETGLRKGEMLNLDWDAVDFVKKTLYITETKTKTNRTIPLSHLAFEIIKERRAIRGDYHPFPKSENDLQKEWTELKKLCGIKNFRWHDLRHSFASWCVKGLHDWLEKPMNLYQLAKFMGHSSVKMTEKYAHLQVDDLQKLIKDKKGKR